MMVKWAKNFVPSFQTNTYYVIINDYIICTVGLTSRASDDSWGQIQGKYQTISHTYSVSAVISNITTLHCTFHYIIK